MNNIKVIQALSDEDKEKCFKIRENVFAIEQKIPKILDFDGEDNNAFHFLCFLEKTPASTGRLRHINNQVKFERIATIKKFRGKGLGKEVMTYMENFAKEAFPSSKLIMHAQISAVSFYKKIGWQTEGDYFTEADIKHIVMTKN